MFTLGQVFVSGLGEGCLPLRLSCTVIMCLVSSCDVPFNCVRELIYCSHLSISALLLKSLERSPR